MQKRWVVPLNEAKSSLHIALPLIASKMFITFTGFMATLYAAHLGKEELAAIAVGVRLFYLLVVFLYGLIGSVSILVAHEFGRESRDGVARAGSNAMFLAVVSALPGLVIVYFLPTLLRLSHFDAAVIHDASVYLHAAIWALIPIQLLNTYKRFLIGLGKAQLVLLISVLQVPCEVVVMYVLVFGKFGLPACGIAGVGYALTIVALLAMLAIVIGNHFSEFGRKYPIFQRLNFFDWRYFKELIRVGMPLGMTGIVESGALTLMVFMIGSIGSDQLAAFQISSQYFRVLIMVVFGIANATMVRVGTAVGKKNREGIFLAANVNRGLALIFISVVIILAWLFTKQLIGLDIDIYKPSLAATVHYAQLFLFIITFSMLFDSVKVVTSSALGGLKDTKVPMYLNFLSLWGVGVIASYCLGFLLHWGALGVVLGLSLGMLCAAVLMQLRFVWRSKRIDFAKILLN